MNQEIKCQICGRGFSRKRSLTGHISAHNITSKEYFDKYLKTDKDGVCLNCGKSTKWNIYKNIYSKFCLNDNKCYGEYVSKGHIMQDREKGIETRRNTLIKRYGTEGIAGLPEIKEKSRQTMLKRYGVSHISQSSRVQRIKEHNALKAKPYILPSGRIVNKRGYEPHFLDFVFNNKIFTEDEIVYSPDGIKYKINNTEHVYFPDFYIPKYNLMVECKSLYTIKLQGGLVVQKAKELGVQNRGYNYVIIMDKNYTPLHNFITEQQLDTSQVFSS